MELESLEQFIWKTVMKYYLEKTTVITGKPLIVILLLNCVWQSFVSGFKSQPTSANYFRPGVHLLQIKVLQLFNYHQRIMFPSFKLVLSVCVHLMLAWMSWMPGILLIFVELLKKLEFI